MAHLMYYKLVPMRKKKTWNNDDLPYRKNCVQSQKTMIEYQKETVIPEDILLKLTTIMVNFQNNKFYIRKVHNTATKKLKLKLSSVTCKPRAYP